MNSKKDLNEKYLSFLDQTKDDTHKAVNHLNDRVLIVDGLNTFIRSFAVNPALNEDGLHIGGMVGFMKSVRYSCDILKPSRCIIVFDGKGGSKRRRKIFTRLGLMQNQPSEGRKFIQRHFVLNSYLKVNSVFHVIKCQCSRGLSLKWYGINIVILPLFVMV